MQAIHTSLSFVLVCVCVRVCVYTILYVHLCVCETKALWGAVYRCSPPCHSFSVIAIMSVAMPPETTTPIGCPLAHPCPVTCPQSQVIPWRSMLAGTLRTHTVSDKQSFIL